MLNPFILLLLHTLTYSNGQRKCTGYAQIRPQVVKSPVCMKTRMIRKLIILSETEKGSLIWHETALLLSVKLLST